MVPVPVKRRRMAGAGFSLPYPCLMTREESSNGDRKTERGILEEPLVAYKMVDRTIRKDGIRAIFPLPGLPVYHS
jgi:hypothetical protein